MGANPTCTALSRQSSAVSCQLSVRRKQDAEFSGPEGVGQAHHLVLDVYRATKSFPREELYGLTSQIRRSAVSVASNIAEGCGRSQGDFGRFVRIEVGSASELELAKDLGFLESVAFDGLSE